MKIYDIVIIGGGHAGCEAAYISAKKGFSIALITFEKNAIARMSCNPSIGGIGKGHIVREIDALGGLMPEIADMAGIQFRLLNTGKGHAVQGLRAQEDMFLYSKLMQDTLNSLENIEIIEGEATNIKIKSKGFDIYIDRHEAISSRSLLICAGTFLNGLMHEGLTHKAGGRVNERSSINLLLSFLKIGIKTDRLKTGTCPRVKASTIDFSKMEEQKGDSVPEFFSLLTKKSYLPQRSCFLTHTTEDTRDVIKKNIRLSPLYSGKIKGIGPRYCPSIEDKVIKFPQHLSHQIFIEPEGLTSEETYLNGLSTSLPLEIQKEILKTVPGLEEAEIIKPGYAVEYDFVPPILLQKSLELKGIPGLFLAGQINGTTGYEEAGALGLYAGYNAIKYITGKNPLILGRNESYIGVMVDDLTSKGVREPYRMFTSRAEFRLSLDRDSVYKRLSHYAEEEGLLSKKMASKIVSLEKEIDNWLNFMDNERSLRLLKNPKVNIVEVEALMGKRLPTNPFIKRRLLSEIRYEGYRIRLKVINERLKKWENLLIPSSITDNGLPGLSREIIERLKEIKPKTLGDASRLPGMTPSAMALIHLHLHRYSK